MASGKDNNTPHGKATSEAESPDWANGLRQLYDSVVDEPIPDSFKDLLAQFDDEPSDTGASGTNGSRSA